MTKYKLSLVRADHYYELGFIFDDFIKMTNFAEMALEACSGEIHVKISTINLETEVKADDNL